MATKDTNYLVAVHKGLDESLEKQVAALPEKFNKQRFLQNCMTVLQDGQADFSKCEAPTVVRTLLKGAFLGLDFFNGECYAIPYGNQCQFQTDYKGEIKLCKRYSSNPIQRTMIAMALPVPCLRQTEAHGRMRRKPTSKRISKKNLRMYQTFS